MDDKVLIQMFLERNPEAIKITETEYGAGLYRFALRIVNVEEDAKECVNDCLLKVWETIPPNEPDSFKAYLYSICRNIALNRVDWNNAKKRKAQIVELTSEMEMCIPAESEDVQENELTEIINEFVKHLSEKNQYIFVRRYWYVDSVKEIAMKTGSSETMIKVSLHRIRKQLKEELKRKGYDYDGR